MDRADQNDRLIGIELLRFTAALSVLIWHYQNFWVPEAGVVLLDRSTQPYMRLLAPFYLYGNAGVQLFWCISGFIFTWKYLEPIHDRRVSFGRFTWLRFSRLYPLHLATLLLVAALNTTYLRLHGSYFQYQINDLRHFVLNLFFISYWGLQDGYSFNGPVWSVSVELVVYGLFFALARRWRGTFWTDLLTIAVVSVTYAGLRKFANVKLEFFGAATFFYMGAATYRLWVWVSADAARRARTATWVSATIVVAMYAAVGLNILKVAGAILAMFPAAILFVQLAVQPRSAAAGKAITFVGNLTYASYMTHFPLQIVMVLGFEALGLRAGDYFFSGWLLPFYLAVVLLLAPAVFYGFEQPAQAWLRQIKGRTRAAPRIG